MTCVWDADFSLMQEQWDEVAAPIKERALTLATSALQSLTYGRVGTCPITIRPCPQSRYPCGCGPTTFHPHRTSEGVWLTSCPCGNVCAPLSEIALPGPVGYVDSLRINGAEVDLTSGEWRLDDGHLLVWQGDGPSPVPATQNLDRPDTEAGTWSVTYSRSYPVGSDGRLAVALLAMEFTKALTPRKSCSLPRGVTNVVRNGVTFTMQAGLFPNGLTGIDPVDVFILKWAPAGSPTQTAVVGDPRALRSRTRVTSAVPLRPPVGSV